ncbi:acyltransferase domain-containing protein, partial [Allosalinactinospora lopnorensis]|uniref:acyltransferase domain-containing protein n=1 Tax=Allosalinactinospora lopnorensis TaxID=1352348 RepID=UPI001F2DAE4A
MFPVFARAFDEVCAEVDGWLSRPLRQVVWAPEGSVEAGLVDCTEFAQPGLFAVEVALFRLVESWGVRPDYVVGHSVGEIAAAYVAGVFSLADAARLVVARGRLMQSLPEGGAMVAVRAGEAEVAPVVADCADRVAVAAVNSPVSTVVSGDEGVVAEVEERFASQGTKTRRLRVSHAFHSPLMEPMLAGFAEAIAGVEFRSPRLPVVSTVSGRLASQEIASPQYWVGQVRCPVRFADAVRCLEAAGVATFVELGPEAGLAGMVGQVVQAESVVVASALRGERDEAVEVFTALGRLHVSGVGVDWEAVFTGSGACRVELPTYAFQRRRYWLEPTPRAG